MQKISLLIAVLLFLHLRALPQKAVSGNMEVGLSIYAAWKDGSKAAFLPSLTIGPGIKFLKMNSFSILLNIPCTVGWNLNKGTYFGINVPLMLNLKMGSASGNDNSSKFGFIIGAGAGYTNIANYYEDSGNKRAQKEFWGYQLRAGINLGKSDMEMNGPTIVFNFGKSFTSGNGYVAGLSLMINADMVK